MFYTFSSVIGKFRGLPAVSAQKQSVISLSRVDKIVLSQPREWRLLPHYSLITKTIHLAGYTDSYIYLSAYIHVYGKQFK